MKKKSKYDTNPLDPDFVRRTEEVRGATSEQPIGEPDAGEQTRHMGGVETEAPTRYYPQAPYRDAAPTSYPSVFIPPDYQPPPAPYQQPFQQQPFQPQQPPPAQPRPQAPTGRTVPGLGLPENVAMILPYLPLPLVGAVPGVLELLLVPRNEVRVRFHAAQGLALHLAVLALSTIFSTAEGIVSSLMRGPFPVLLSAASTLLTLAATVFFIISMIRVWKGEPLQVETLAPFTRWLNEKLEPRK